MTDRVKGFIVTLDHDVREDDIEAVVTALRMIRCVAAVDPIPAKGYDDHIIRTRVMDEIQLEIRELLAKWNRR